MCFIIQAERAPLSALARHSSRDASGSKLELVAFFYWFIRKSPLGNVKGSQVVKSRIATTHCYGCFIFQGQNVNSKCFRHRFMSCLWFLGALVCGIVQVIVHFGGTDWRVLDPPPFTFPSLHRKWQEVQWHSCPSSPCAMTEKMNHIQNDSHMKNYGIT